LITAIGLHLHFLHLALNLLATLILCSRIEQTYRVWYTMLFYFLSGIMGNIFSDCVNTNVFRVAVGASTALYGLVGVLLGYIVINWAGLAFMPAAHKCRLVMVVVMMLLFSIFFINTGASENVDYYGHLGGFLGGLWLAGIPPSILNNSREKMLRGVAIGLFCVQALICFLVFYLGKPELQIFRLF
jgi:rhomboid protease GluP